MDLLSRMKRHLISLQELEAGSGDQESLSYIELTEILGATFGILCVSHNFWFKQVFSVFRDRWWGTQLLNYSDYYLRFLSNEMPDFI